MWSRSALTDRERRFFLSLHASTPRCTQAAVAVMAISKTKTKQTKQNKKLHEIAIVAQYYYGTPYTRSIHPSLKVSPTFWRFFFTIPFLCFLAPLLLLLLLLLLDISGAHRPATMHPPPRCVVSS